MNKTITIIFSAFFVAKTAVLALIICYIVATLWRVILTKTPFISAMVIGVLPFIPGDILKIFVATFIARSFDKRKNFTF